MTSPPDPDHHAFGPAPPISTTFATRPKPKDPDTVRDTLFALRGKTHQLHSAVALAEGGQVTWTYIATAHLTMRPFSPQFLGRYLAAAGPQAHQSVGAYQLDGLGIQLFDRIEGDYFAILGLPLLVH